MGAVTSAKLADFAVGAQKIGGNAVGTANIVDGAILTADIAMQQITSDRIAPLAVGTSQVNSDQVQRRVTGSCPAGSALRAIDASGAAPTCESTAGNGWSRHRRCRHESGHELPRHERQPGAGTARSQSPRPAAATVHGSVRRRRPERDRRVRGEHRRQRGGGPRWLGAARAFTWARLVPPAGMRRPRRSPR
jgi:hypothetical protein